MNSERFCYVVGFEQWTGFKDAVLVALVMAAARTWEQLNEERKGTDTRDSSLCSLQQML
jgi:hypothetical protein